MDGLFVLILSNFLIDFIILLLVILILLFIFECLKLLGLVGFLFVGIVLGKSGLGVLNEDLESIKFFIDIGKIYLMFVVGLEIDMVDFCWIRNCLLLYGFFIFVVLLLMGLVVGLIFGYFFNVFVLFGFLFVFYILLGYFIV